MATNLSNNLFSELFLYVPSDKTQEFKQHCTDYKSYIAFLEETHEIYVNGKSFGYNYDELLEEIWSAIHNLQSEMLQLETDFNTHKDEVDTTVQNYKDDITTALQTHRNETNQALTNYQTGVNNQINQINNNITGLNTLISQEGTARETLASRLDAKDTQLETKNSQQDVSINSISNQIGRENQSGSILYRIKQLENRWL